MPREKRCTARSSVYATGSGAAFTGTLGAPGSGILLLFFFKLCMPAHRENAKDKSARRAVPAVQVAGPTWGS